MAARVPWDPAQTPYPVTRRDEQYVEKFKSAKHGDVEVPDPYVWLEDPDSEETASFVKEQAAFTESYLQRCEPIRTKFRESLTKAQNYPRFSVPSLKGDGYYYHSYNSGLQSQAVIYRVKKGEEDSRLAADPSGPAGELFFDTNLLSTDGTVALGTTAFSRDGQYFAYAVSKSGSDWQTIYLRKTTSPHRPDQTPGNDEGRLDDVLRDVKFSSVVWDPDSTGFFYGRFPKVHKGTDDDDKQGTETDMATDQELFYHKIGQDQKDDILIAKRDVKGSTWMWSPDVSEDGRYLYLYVSKDTGRSNLLWICDIKEHGIRANLPWLKLVDEWGAEYNVFANDGTKQYLSTNKDAPRDKLVTIDLASEDKNFHEYLPEDEAVLKSAHVTADKLVLLYSRDVRDELLLYDLPTGKKVGRIGGDLVGVISSPVGKRHHGEFWFNFSDFTNPGQAYRYQFHGTEKGQELSLYRSTKVSGVDPSAFASEQVFYHSKDGTRVPMFIVSAKGQKRDGTAPAILYGYGGFSISIEPFFSPAMMTFIKHFGGVLAVANIRGGGEYGESWHLDGCFGKKQNVFDDFQAAAQYLQEHKVASQVAISGGSNGGLLVAACVNQRPDLFAAGVADVGVMDMLKFDRFTIGKAWTADYGHPDKPEDFDYLRAYSPVHNVDHKAVYPPVMLLTGDHDDRVVPLHSLKLAATLQHARPDNLNPLLLRLDLKSGHGAGKSTEKRIEEVGNPISGLADGY